MSVSKAFTVLSLFTNLQHPINQAHKAFQKLLLALVAVDRLKKLSKLSKNEAQLDSLDLDLGEILIEEGNFGWNDEEFDELYEEKKLSGKREESGDPGTLVSYDEVGGEGIALKDINLRIRPQEFVAVVGQVGAGKSALLYAMLDEMVPKRDSSRVYKNGKISLISQEAFLLNDTIKNNILFGQPYDEEKYQKTLRICQLEPDLQILPGGDLT